MSGHAFMTWLCWGGVAAGIGACWWHVIKAAKRAQRAEREETARRLVESRGRENCDHHRVTVERHPCADTQWNGQPGFLRARDFHVAELERLYEMPAYRGCND
jgi:hypothetical protein